MQFFKASVLSALVAAVSALQVTYPSQGSSLDLSRSNTITWSSVSSDPSSFSIVLVNQNVNPAVSINIASNVQASEGSYTMRALSGVSASSGYQVNLMSTATNNQGILAQSAQFDVVRAGASTTSVSFSSSTPGTSSATGSSSTMSTMSSTASTSSASGSSSSSAAAASSSAAAASTSAAASSSAMSSTSSSASAASASASAGAAAGLHIASGATGLGFVALIAALFA